MSTEYNAVIGSGTIPNVANGPVHNIPQGAYPVPSQRDSLRNRRGEGIVVLNPEDFSVSVGLRSQAITVGVIALPLPANPLEYRRALVVHNNGTATIYLGDVSVTTIDGLPLLAGEKIAFDITGVPNTTVYAIASSSVDVRVMELS